MDQDVEHIDTMADRLLPSVERVMDVSETSLGSSKVGYLARFQGQLRIDSQIAFDALQPKFAREGASLLLRQDGEAQVVLAIEEPEEMGTGAIWINVALAVATFATVLFAGFGYGQSYAQRYPTNNLFGQALPLALVYSASLLGILGAHEFGHYLAGRYHKIKVSLPYFIPFPGGFLGTFGAFIRLKSRPKNRRHLLDMGLAGPYAGLIVALPLLIVGLSLSEVAPIEAPPRGAVAFQEGNSIFYLAAKYLIKGELLPAPADLAGDASLLYWLRNIAVGVGGPLGAPIPIGGRDIQMHPMAVAAWAGLLVTGINLIPAGQLDGGHSIYAWLGAKATRIWPFVVVFFVALVFVWRGWFLFAAIVFLLGRTYAEPEDNVTELDSGRVAAAILALVIFVLTFTPAPLIIIPGF